MRRYPGQATGAFRQADRTPSLRHESCAPLRVFCKTARVRGGDSPEGVPAGGRGVSLPAKLLRSRDHACPVAPGADGARAPPCGPRAPPCASPPLRLSSAAGSPTLPLGAAGCCAECRWPRVLAQPFTSCVVLRATIPRLDPRGRGVEWHSAARLGDLQDHELRWRAARTGFSASCRPALPADGLPVCSSSRVPSLCLLSWPLRAWGGHLSGALRTCCAGAHRSAHCNWRLEPSQEGFLEVVPPEAGRFVPVGNRRQLLSATRRPGTCALTCCPAAVRAARWRTEPAAGTAGSSAGACLAVETGAFSVLIFSPPTL